MAVRLQKQMQAIELDFQGDEDITIALKAQTASLQLDIEAAEQQAAKLQVCSIHPDSQKLESNCCTPRAVMYLGPLACLLGICYTTCTHVRYARPHSLVCIRALLPLVPPATRLAEELMLAQAAKAERAAEIGNLSSQAQSAALAAQEQLVDAHSQLKGLSSMCADKDSQL